MRSQSSCGSFRLPVERTCRPTSSKITGRDSRFIINMDFSWVLALSSSIWVYKKKNLVIYIVTIIKIKLVCHDPYLSCTSTHLNELPGYNFHHLTYLEMNVDSKKVNNTRHEPHLQPIPIKCKTGLYSLNNFQHVYKIILFDRQILNAFFKH